MSRVAKRDFLPADFMGRSPFYFSRLQSVLWRAQRPKFFTRTSSLGLIVSHGRNVSCPHPVRAGSLTDRIRHPVWTQCGAGVGTGDGEAVRFLEGRWMSYLNSSPLWNQLGGTQGGLCSHQKLGRSWKSSNFFTLSYARLGLQKLTR